MQRTNIEDPPGIFASLRAVARRREPKTVAQAYQVANWQADQLLNRFSIHEAPVPLHIVSELPCITVVQEAGLPVSGSTHWNGKTWVVVLSATDSAARQRETLFHMFKRILDHGQPVSTVQSQAGQVADFFVACALVPKKFLVRAWRRGMRSPSALAGHFQVSPLLISMRLRQVGLDAGRRYPPSAASTQAEIVHEEIAEVGETT